jgi:hypothetical protein
MNTKDQIYAILEELLEVYENPSEAVEDIKETAINWLQNKLETAPQCSHKSPYCGCPSWYQR